MIFCPGGSPPLQRAEFCIIIRVTGRGRKDCLLPRMVCGELAWGRRGESELDGVGKTLGDTGNIPFRLGYERQRAAVLYHAPAWRRQAALCSCVSEKQIRVHVKRRKKVGQRQDWRAVWKLDKVTERGVPFIGRRKFWFLPSFMGFGWFISHSQHEPESALLLSILQLGN